MQDDSLDQSDLCPERRTSPAGAIKLAGSPPADRTASEAGKESLVVLTILIAVTLLVILICTPAHGEPRAPARDRDRMTHRYMRSWTEIRRENIVMQQRDYSCGAAVLATVVHYYWGDDVDEDYFLKVMLKVLTVKELKDRIENGLALTDLKRIAVKAKYQATMGTLTIEKLSESKVPLIVGITVDGHDHFAVFRGTDGTRIYLADPIRGNVRVPKWEFEQQWQKNAVLVVAKKGEKVKKVNPLAVREEEIRLGEINAEYVRKEITRLQPRGPMSIRP